ncbi:unnamed protein product [Chrysoparadoxa australica]
MTGSGKTHTMLGEDLWLAAFQRAEAAPSKALQSSNAGLIPRTARWLFSEAPPSAVQHVCVSYLEIHNDRVYDLLTSGAREGSGLAIKVDAGEVCVPGCRELEVASEEDIMNILWMGARNRAVSTTDMNLHSSRSHTIFVMRVEGNTGYSKVCMVDLAGSEKWNTFRNDVLSKGHINELRAINQSLSTLSNCMYALQEKGRTHIPYRNSKLTRLLQDSLGGNTLTSFLACLSPSSSCTNESLGTLEFADRAMDIEVLVTPNQHRQSSAQEADVERLREEIEDYKEEIRELKEALQQAMLDGDGGGEGFREVEYLTHLLEEERKENAALSAALWADDSDDPTAVQFKALEAEREILVQRQDALLEAYSEQDSTWSWLVKYHSWIKSVLVQGRDASAERQQDERELEGLENENLDKQNERVEMLLNEVALGMAGSSGGDDGSSVPSPHNLSAMARIALRDQKEGLEKAHRTIAELRGALNRANRTIAACRQEQVPESPHQRESQREFPRDRYRQRRRVGRWEYSPEHSPANGRRRSSESLYHSVGTRGWPNGARRQSAPATVAATASATAASYSGVGNPGRGWHAGIRSPCSPSSDGHQQVGTPSSRGTTVELCGAPSEWKRYTDPTCNQVYLYNHRTKESRWLEPVVRHRRGGASATLQNWD